MLQKEIITFINEEKEMGLSLDYRSSLPCWEIMGCDSSEECPAKEHPEVPCWEVAHEMDDHRKGFNICRDCIVRVLKTNISSISF